ncbi:MAG: MarR family transcriptional regulator [Ahrensia sp.]|nr:MarR family transcriptional regulator [Ahrensia sp.]
MDQPQTRFPVSPARIDAVRRFNRFHTRLVGALDEHLLESGYSLPQARIVYELASLRGGEKITAADLGLRLGMDAGYLSRLIAALEKDWLVARTPAPTNAKKLLLALTSNGEALAEKLNAASAGEVAELLAPLNEAEQMALVGAMARIKGLLGPAPSDPAIVLRDPEPGDLGWVVHRQGFLYGKEYGWDWTFEGLLGAIVGKYVETYDPSCERCWIAEMDGEIAGSVFVVREDAETAKLRMLYVEPCARGHGLGRRLVDEAIRFARARGYKKMVLWTNDILTAARRIYEQSGFTLISEEPHRSYGKDLVGQYWEKAL